MAVGERREFIMAWVTAPALTLRLMRQAYTRLDDGLYPYQNLATYFQTQLSVEADDIVIDYQGVFRRIY